MRKLSTIVLAAVGVMALAGVAAAAEAAPAAASSAKLDSFGLALTAFAAVIGMAVAAFGCGIGQGLGLKAACEGVARNPEASNKLTTMLLLGLAFIESLAIYTLVISLLLLFVNPFI
jgi:F-type H+-transporting ATPase subunit c